MTLRQSFISLGLLFVFFAGKPMAALHTLNRATLLGSGGNDRLNAVVICVDDMAWIGGKMSGPVPGDDKVKKYDLLGGKAGCLIRYDLLADRVFSVTTLANEVDQIEVGEEGHVYVRAGAIHKLSADGSQLIWSSSVSGPFALGPKDKIYMLDKNQVAVLNTEGKVEKRWSLQKFADDKWRPIVKNICVDRSSNVVVVAGKKTCTEEGVPLDLPLIQCWSLTGSIKWNLYDFKATEVIKAEDVAKTEVVQIRGGLDGKLYVAGTLRGGNSVFRHDPRYCGKDLSSRVLKGAPYAELQNASSDRMFSWVGRFSGSTGFLEKLTYVYGSFQEGAEGQEKTVIGQTQVSALAADEEGSLVITGTIHCLPMITSNAVHQKVSGRQRKDFFGQPIGTPEAFLMVLVDDMSLPLFYSGLSQGQSEEYDSHGMDVAIRAGRVLLAGWARSPGSIPPESGATVYTLNPWQKTFAGGEDAYLLMAGRGASYEVNELMTAFLQRLSLSSEEAKNLCVELQRTGVYGMASLKVMEKAGGEQGDSLAKREMKQVVQVIEEGGTLLFERAKAMSERSSEAGAASQMLTSIARAWAGHAIGKQAGDLVERLEKDPVFQNNIKAQKDFTPVMEIFATLKGEGSFLEFDFRRSNKMAMGRIQNKCQFFLKKYADTDYADKVKALAQKYVLPLSDEEEAADKIYDQFAKLREKLRKVKDAEESWNDEKYMKGNGKILTQMRGLLKSLDAEHPGSVWTREAATQAAVYGIPRN